MAIRLFQSPTSMFCEKVRIVLVLKNIPYEVVDVKRNQREALIEFSAQRKVPVMDYHGQCVIDSTVICAFLEEKHPEQSIYPNNPSDKGSCLMLEDWSDEVLLNAILLIRWAENPEARIEGEKKLAIHLQSLDQFFNRKGFIFERLTIADMSIFTQLHYLYTVVKYEIPADYRDLHTWMDLMRKSLKLSSLYDLVV